MKSLHALNDPLEGLTDTHIRGMAGLLMWRRNILFRHISEDRWRLEYDPNPRGWGGESVRLRTFDSWAGNMYETYLQENGQPPTRAEIASRVRR